MRDFLFAMAFVVVFTTGYVFIGFESMVMVGFGLIYFEMIKNE